VWMVAENAVFIYNRRVTAAVNDLMAGPWGLYTTRSARYGTPGGQLAIGQPVHWNSQWNSYRGFTWLYDATQMRALTDPGIYYHPTTGLTVPVRATADVVTAGPCPPPPATPCAPLAIPSGTMVYNTTAAQFENAPAGASATTKIVYNYTFAPWHDGSTMSMADIWYTIASYYRREGGTDRAVNPYTGTQFPVGDIGAIDPRADSPTVNQWLGLFKGARQVDADTMEIYADYWHVDPGTMAVTMDVWQLPAQPWQVHELQVQAVLDNASRFDAGQAQTDGKPVVDLIRGPTLPLLDARIGPMAAAHHLPPGAASMGITTAQADARWAALDAFRLAHNHYFVSNGPFYLDQANVPVKQTVLKRAANYPFPADHWDSFIAPTLPSVTIGSVPDIVPGIPASIPVNTALGATPTSNLNVTYLIRNVGLDETVLVGRPTTTGTAGVWSINLDQNTTGRLIPGAHEITVTALAGELGIPVGTLRAFIVIPLTVYLGKLIQDQNAIINGLQQDLKRNSDQLSAANAQISSLNTLLTVAIIVAIISVVVSVISMAVSRRGPKGPGRMHEPPMEKTGEDL
jgi:peptide/nickel transport system substrate-binding protein